MRAKKSEYLGVKIEKLSDGSIKMIQPYLMDHRVKGLGINDRTKAKSRIAVVPMESTNSRARKIFQNLLP